MKKSIIALVFVLLFASFAFVQADTHIAVDATSIFKYEGYPVILNAPSSGYQAPGVSSVRFAPAYPLEGNKITLTDLDLSTPFSPRACNSGTTITVVSTVNGTVASNAYISRPGGDKYCFTTEDTRVKLSFQGDSFSGRVTYITIPNPSGQNGGVYNVRDFGAVGDGITDDTQAVRGALAFAANTNGGTVKFPSGDYLVGSSEPNFTGIALPSGVIVEGVGSSYTGAPTWGSSVVGRGVSRITLKSFGTNSSDPGQAIFQIGENTERVAIRDIELFVAPNTSRTYGIESLGAYNSAQDIFVERVAFTNFARGIYIHTLWDIHNNFQSDFWKIEKSRFVLNRDAGIYADIWNSDLAIRGNFFTMPKQETGVAADGFKAIKIGMVTFEDNFAGYPGDRTLGHGGDLIDVFEPGPMIIKGSQSEASARSLVVGEGEGSGNLSYPITLMGNIFGDGIEIRGRKVITSMGNLYGATTWSFTHPEVQINSLGDRFCYDNSILGCQTTATPSWGGGTIIFDTGQPKDIDRSSPVGPPIPERSPVIPSAGFPRGNPLNQPTKTGKSFVIPPVTIVAE